jgi:glycosyltransferase involved in cell wall biosynthesis
VSDAPSGKDAACTAQRPLRLAYFVSHPIQYQAPLLRRIAQERDIDMKVFFSSDISVRGYIDQGFGVRVEWDTPLLDGYEHEFLPALRKVKEGASPGFLQPLNYGMARRLRAGNFDAVWVHGYNYLTHLQAIRASNSMRIPVLLRAESTLHDRPRSRMKLAAKKLFFDWLKPRVSAVLSIGKENTAYWQHHLGRDFPSFPFNYAVDNEFFQAACANAAKTREEFRASLDLEPGRPIVLFAAKLSPRKRCGDLLDAYLKLAEAYHQGPLPYLLIVGDGEERQMLESRTKQAPAGAVRFLGFRNQSELPRFYDLCDVFVLASVDEPWGLAVNEAMNAARPIVVSDAVGCQADLVRDGVNGFVVRAGDVGALAESMRRVCADPHVAHAMGAESLRIIDGYSFEQDVAGLRQALHAVASGFPLEAV